MGTLVEIMAGLQNFMFNNLLPANFKIYLILVTAFNKQLRGEKKQAELIKNKEKNLRYQKLVKPGH